MIEDLNTPPLEVLFTVLHIEQGIRIAFHIVPGDIPNIDKDTIRYDDSNLHALLSNPFSSVEELKERLNEIGLPEEIADAVDPSKQYSVSKEQLTRINFPFPLFASAFDNSSSPPAHIS